MEKTYTPHEIKEINAVARDVLPALIAKGLPHRVAVEQSFALGETYLKERFNRYKR